MIRVTTIVVMVFVMAATALAQTAPSQAPAPDYRIGVLDVLTITVRNEKDLSGDVTVRSDGKIALKVGKEIMALGLRPDELKTKVVEELSNYFKPVPEVTIQVKQIVSRMKLTPAAAAAIAAPPPMLEVSGPTYFADGEIRGATAGRAMKLKEPFEIYQASGKTLCASASATPIKPTDAGSGWRLTITPLRLASEVVLSVDGQRLWERGEALANGPKGRAVIALQAGERVLLDYISAGDLLGPSQSFSYRPGDPDRPVAMNSAGCNAVGMGLQIGLPPVESQTFVEANLWLVRTLADGSERVRQQTVRARAGTTAEFVFDDETIGLAPAKPGAAGAAQPAERQVRTSGRLRPVGASDGKVTMEVTLAQHLVERPGTADRMNGGSATFELTAGPEEVVAFRVPQVADDAGRVGERMSLRVQVKVLRYRY